MQLFIVLKQTLFYISSPVYAMYNLTLLVVGNKFRKVLTGCQYNMHNIEKCGF